jgi:glucokinase
MHELAPTRAVLLADIGGTNSRFALAGPDGRPERVVILENEQLGSLEAAITRYLGETGVHPHAAVLAVAAPVDGEDIALTNRAWRFRRNELARRFGFAQLRIVNDFEAIAWGLTRLSSDDVHALGPERTVRAGIKAVFGPGTGLGVAALVPVEERWHVLASEGGHITFGPQRPDEMAVFARLVREHGVVTAETILSGPGLPRLMRAVEPGSQRLTPEAVVVGALAGEASALATVQLFVRLLGRFAGGLALTFKAIGGVYIAGGVASRLGALLDGPAFRAAFEAHPPYQALLASIPTWLMSRSEPGLLGCAVLADELATSEGPA